MPDPAGACPFPETDFGHQRRGNPVGLAFDLRVGGERTASLRQCDQCLDDVCQRLPAEARADISRILQRALRIVHAQQQRTEAKARTPRAGVAADHELLALAALQFEPVGCARTPIAGVRFAARHGILR